jgi:MFS family permease
MNSRLRTLADSYLDAYRGLPREVWLLSLVLLINRCGTMVLPFWTLYCISERGFTETQVGTLLAIYGVGSVVGAFVGGWLTTRIGALRVQWLSLFLTGTGFLVLLLVQTWQQIAIAFIVLSIVSEAIRPASSTATANLCDPVQHPRAMALNRLAVNLGMSVGPVLGGFLAGRSFALLFWCDALTCFAAGIGFLLIFGFGDETRSINSQQRSNVLRPWRDRQFACFGFFNFLLAIVFFQLMGTYVLYFDQVYGLQKFQIGLLMSINTVSIVLLEMVLVRQVERFHILRVVAVGFLFSGLGFCVLPWGRGMLWAAFSVALWTIGEMLSMPLAAAFSAGRSGPEERGNYMGAFSMSYAAAFVVAPIVGMWAYSIQPNYVWYGGLVLTLIATGGTWWLSYRDDPLTATTGSPERAAA